jgi:hypothetical protein
MSKNHFFHPVLITGALAPSARLQAIIVEDIVVN